MMRKVRPTELADYDPDGFVALEVLSSEHSNVRLIRLSPGTTLPPHTHGASDLFLHVVEGSGELDTPDGPVPLQVGDLAHFLGDEELRLSNTSATGLTLLAFLAPAFPPTEAGGAA
jgi:quercetin dioxygenase-like cupin family protein